MKKFKDILNENKKVYTFLIKVAGDLPDNFENCLEQSLLKFNIDSLSPAKTTPIMVNPTDFPRLSNIQVNSFNVALLYPTTSEILQEYLTYECKIMPGYLKVKPFHEESKNECNINDKIYEPLLTTDYDPSIDSQNQELVGEKRLMQLFKELEDLKKSND